VGAVGLFFQPIDRRATGNTERTFQSTQATAFLIGVQDFFFPLRGIGATARIIATLPSASATIILLLTVGGNTIFGEVRTAAMPARDKLGNHGVKPFS
jgi:hypothetical protein